MIKIQGKSEVTQDREMWKFILQQWDFNTVEEKEGINNFKMSTLLLYPVFHF